MSAFVKTLPFGDGLLAGGLHQRGIDGKGRLAVALPIAGDHLGRGGGIHLRIDPGKVGVIGRHGRAVGRAGPQGGGETAGDGKGNEGKGSAKGHGASLGEKPPDGRHGTRRVSSNAPEAF